MRLLFALLLLIAVAEARRRRGGGGGGAAAPARSSMFLSLTVRRGEAGSPLSEERAFEGPISVGTPAQKFDVRFTMDESRTWIPKEGCINRGGMDRFCRDKQGLYDQRVSKSTKRVRGGFTTTRVKRGQFTRETLSLGDPAWSNIIGPRAPVVIGTAVETHGGDVGTLGLGLPVSNGLASSIVDVMQKEGQFGQPVVSFYVNRDCALKEGCKGAAWVNIGSEDQRHCGAVISYAPVNEDSPDWEFEIDRAVVGGFRGPVNRAKADPETAFVWMAEAPVKAIAAKLGGRFTKKGIMMFPWKNVANAPAIQLRIGGRNYEIPGKEYIRQVSGRLGMAMVRKAEDSQWRLGGSFVDLHCIVMDWASRRVGFAPVK